MRSAGQSGESSQEDRLAIQERLQRTLAKNVSAGDLVAEELAAQIGVPITREAIPDA